MHAAAFVHVLDARQPAIAKRNTLRTKNLSTGGPLYAANGVRKRAAIAWTNAFATGHSEKTAVLCVTTGLIRRLEGPELEAVVAHELSHIAHRDVMVMTVAGFLGIVLIALACLIRAPRPVATAGPPLPAL